MLFIAYMESGHSSYHATLAAILVLTSGFSLRLIKATPALGTQGWDEAYNFRQELPQGAHTNGATVDVQNYKGMYEKRSNVPISMD